MAAATASIAAELPTLTFTVERYVVVGDNPLSEAATEAALAPYTGELDGLGALQKAAQALEIEIRQRGFSFHRVIIPPQQATGGEFTLEVLSFKLGDIEVQGNQHFSAENIARSLPALVPGETPNARALSKHVQAANEHPAKRVNVTMRQSAQPDHVDALVEVREVDPQQLFASFSNQGTDASGETRASVGYQHSNLFDLDHVFTGSYTTSPEAISRVRQLGLFYQVPVYRLAGQASAFFAHSDVDTGRVADFFDVAGAGTFFGLRYRQALPSVGDYQHKLGVSLEDKFFENDVAFLGVPIGNDVRSRPVGLRYSGGIGSEWGNVDLYTEYVRNLTSGKDNTRAAYSAARAGAVTGWDAFRYGIRATYLLPRGWELRAAFDGQHAGEPLISGEQFGSGGANSVRAFEEREIAGDDGEEINIEIYTPVWEHNLRFLGFADWGRIRLQNPQPGDTPRETIAGLGVGVRWHYKSNVNASFDFGYAANGARETTRGETKLHFSLFFRY